MNPSSDPPAEAAALLMRHRSYLFGFIYACLRNYSDAEDVLQEVSLAVVQSFAKLTEPAGFLPWAREIARRQVLLHLQRRQRLTFLPPQILDALEESAARNGQQKIVSRRMEALLECLERLPAHLRLVMSKRYDNSAGGIEKLAEEMGRTVSATYGVLKRARLTVFRCVERKLAREQQP